MYPGEIARMRSGGHVFAPATLVFSSGETPVFGQLRRTDEDVDDNDDYAADNVLLPVRPTSPARGALL